MPVHVCTPRNWNLAAVGIQQVDVREMVIWKSRSVSSSPHSRLWCWLVAEKAVAVNTTISQLSLCSMQ